MADFQRLSEIIAEMRRTPGRYGNQYLRKIYATPAFSEQTLETAPPPPQDNFLHLDGIDREFLRECGIEA